MNSKIIITSLAAAVLFAGLGAHAVRAEDEDDQAKLAAEAKVTKEQAQAVATKAVPTGTLKESEIENEDGNLIWSFEFTTPGTTDTSEVNIDAKTGQMVGGVEVEKAEDEKKEAQEEKGEKEDKD